MKTYKPSYYNFIKEVSDNKLIYNTKTGSVSIIEPQSCEKFMEMLTKPKSEYVKDELFQKMLEEGYVINDDVNELKDLEEVSRLGSSISNILRLTILPTETCNFICPYCFIYSRRNQHMRTETWNALYKVCANFCEEKKNEEAFLINLIWYGGEPLIVADKIIAFMEKINKLLENYPNCKLISSLLTNGYLLNYNLFNELNSVNIHHIQVTVDGDAENHDKLRTLADKKPTFDKIYANILEISKKVSDKTEFTFAIRCNFLKSSVPSSKRLLELFKKDFSQDNRFHIYFRPVYDFETDRNSDEIEKTDYFNMEDGIKMQNSLLFSSGQNIMDEQKVTNPLPEPITSWCDSVNENAYIIGYDGSVYICDTLITDSKDAVGILKSDGTIELNEKAKCWRKSIFNREDEPDSESAKECMRCKLLPVCMGGCVRTRMNNSGKACFWTEELIYEAMDKYANMYK